MSRLSGDPNEVRANGCDLTGHYNLVHFKWESDPQIIQATAPC